MEFLTDNTRYQLDHHFDGTIPALNAKGKDVVVIGGGDTGTDCVGTSLRHGCKSVIQLEIMPQPPREARRRTTRGPSGRRFTRWTTARKKPPPSKARTRASIWCRPSVSSRTTPAIYPVSKSATSSGSTTKAASCPRKKKAAPASSPRNSCLLAMGFLGPEQEIVKQFALETDARSNVKAEHGKFTTNVPGVFAAGDMRRGQSLVVWAINEGRGAARECDRFLMGATNLP